MNSSVSYKMQIEWGNQTETWFERASKVSCFHKNLAEILAARLSADDTVCDLGCGTGMIDFHLKEKVKHITCIDRVPEAVKYINDRIDEEQILNMEAKCSDIRELSGMWDSCIMLFVGMNPSDIKKLLQHCRNKLLIVYRGGCQINPEIKGGVRKQKSLLPVFNDFLAEGIHCSMKDYSLEYGQPLTDLIDAYNYVSFYHRNPKTMGVMDYIHSNMIRTYQLPYPYYLPHQKKFGIIEIKKEDNKEENEAATS